MSNWSDEEPAYELAHKDYDEAVFLDPENTKYWHQKGLTYQWQAEEAIKNK